jgi:hypothetical protein
MFQVSDEGISALVQGECGNSLMELHLEKCLHITDSAIKSIVSHCNKMKILVFHGCHVSGILMFHFLNKITFN